MENTLNDQKLSYDFDYILGFGVSALHNMINHSCDPNVSDFSRRREHAFFALRPIKLGEQVYKIYE